MCKLGKGVPSGTFSGIEALYSLLLNAGASSLTSLIVILSDIKVSELVVPTAIPFSVSNA